MTLSHEWVPAYEDADDPATAMLSKDCASLDDALGHVRDAVTEARDFGVRGVYLAPGLTAEQAKTAFAVVQEDS